MAQALGGFSTLSSSSLSFFNLFANIVHVEVFHRVDHLIEGRAGQSSRLGEDEDAVAESHQGGDGANVCRTGEVALGFSVDLPERNVGVFSACFLVYGGKSFTGSTPLSPEINKGDSFFGYGGFEVCFGEVNGGHGCPFVARHYTPWGIPRGGLAHGFATGYAEGVNRGVAWGLVAGQFALIIALAVIPAGSLWPRGPLVWVVASAFFIVAAVVGVLGGTRLGSNLTPNPIPKPGGTLETGGLYRFVRHPIYSAVFALALALTVLGASIAHLAIFVMLVMLLGIKARAEERLLRERFPDYREYQATVGRFIPGIGRIR